MNEHETDRIAAATHQLRPDWPATSIRTLIRTKLADRPRRDVAVALAWIACEPTSKTPARVLESGPWWLAAGVAGDTTGRRDPYDPDTFCATCGWIEPRCRLNPNSGHEYESATDLARRLAHDADRKQPLRELTGRVEIEGESHG